MVHHPIVWLTAARRPTVWTRIADTGARLCPVFAVRDRSGRFVVEIQPPLEVPADADRTVRSEAVARQLAERLSPFATACPEQLLMRPVETPT
ncbi:MAG: hypothetical protein MJB57_03555 [Gemmatimonadetes bacterium]|nr:hypothetical protein [Gemmatimonadota bacterium]